jgi:DNA helicase IV
MNKSRRGYGLELTEEISHMGQVGYVYFSTIKSFKGMEAENVILVQASRLGASHSFQKEDLYVACTRANGRFAVVTTDQQAHEWFSSSIV